MAIPRPADAYPGPLMTSEPGSFAEATIVRRKPQIIAEVLRDNDYPPEIQRSLHALDEEIKSGAVHPLVEPAPDVEEWQTQWCPYAGLTWRQLPWYFAEAFFYRRLLEAVRYFQPGIWQGIDPFAAAKGRQIAGPGGALALAAALLPTLPEDPLASARALLHASLWGNRIDLSNRQVLAGAALQAGHPRDILIDDSEEILAYLTKGGPHERIDFINDNAGPEATCDLLLADTILERGWARQVRMHLKPYPFFVSDAMIQDVRELIARLEGEQEPLSRAAGDRLAGWLRMGTLELVDHPFWTSAHSFMDMPDDLRLQLAQAGLPGASACLVIVKGDANYRRLLGDRHWPFTARLATIVAYFPAPLAVLRTLKAEIMVGLEEGRAERLAAEDAQWLINGRRGLIQLVVPG
jgi:hypothetical protein